MLKDRKKEIQKKKWNQFFEMCLYVLIVVVVTYFIASFLVQRTDVQGQSMYPTLENRDQLLLEKITYRFSEPKRYDIIVFETKDQETGEIVHYIKRIIGLPGETILIRNGVIYVDDEPLADTYGYYSDNQLMEGYDAQDEMYVDENQYFVLGDNRNDSTDSRQIGCISKEDILGRAIFRMFPLQKIGTIR